MWIRTKYKVIYTYIQFKNWLQTDKDLGMVTCTTYKLVNSLVSFKIMPNLQNLVFDIYDFGKVRFSMLIAMTKEKDHQENGGEGRLTNKNIAS